MQHGPETLGPNRNLVNAAFTIALLTILGAWAFQYIGGYQPCELCYAQRIPYYWGIPILAVLIFMWARVPPLARLITTLVVFAIFVWSAYLGSFHAGVEWGWWPGPQSCTGLGDTSMDFSQLGNMNNAKVVPCDVAQWRFLGISFAGYNGLISALVALLLGLSAWGQTARMRKA